VIRIESVTGIIIKDRAVLMVRPKGKNYFLSPGGKPGPGESYEQTLCRELSEELSIMVTPEDLVFFGIYHARAKGQAEKEVELHTYFVKGFSGIISPSNEIDEVAWFNTIKPEPNDEHSIFKHEVIPQLKQEGLID
jgi:8-oxo-dGTP diphosphatase